MAAHPGSAASDEHDRRRTDRYAMVLLLLVASFLLSAFLPRQPVRIIPLALYLAALILALRSSQPLHRQRWAGRLAGGMTAVSALVAVADLLWRNRVTYGVTSLVRVGPVRIRSSEICGAQLRRVGSGTCRRLACCPAP